MDIMDAIRARHSVRQYTGEPIAAEHIAALEKEISLCNEESGLHIQLITGVPDAFSAFLAHYGWLSGASDYIALVGNPGMEEACGYYGERLVLQALAEALERFLGGQISKQGIGRFAVYVDFLELRKFGAELHLAELVNLVIATRRLVGKLVAREIENLETLVAVFLVHSLERLVMGRKTTARSRVDDEQNLAFVLTERLLAAVACRN